MSKSVNKKRICLFALVIAYMVIIFAFSAQTGVESGNLSEGITVGVCRIFLKNFVNLDVEQQKIAIDRVDEVIRTFAHGTEFAVLAMTIFGLLCTYSKVWVVPLFKSTRWALATLFASFYAVTDEIHQIFVEGRACDVFDWSVDTIGAAVGASVAVVISVCLLKWRNKNGLS